MLEAFIKCEPNSELWNALVKHIVLQLNGPSTFKFFCAWACIGKTEETEGVILVKCSLNVPDLSLKLKTMGHRGFSDYAAFAPNQQDSVLSSALTRHRINSDSYLVTP